MLPLEVLGENLFFASSSFAGSWQSLQFLGLPLHYSNLCLHLAITFSSPSGKNSASFLQVNL